MRSIHSSFICFNPLSTHAVVLTLALLSFARPRNSCLKLYCQCFALSSTCGPKCKCQTCHNTPLHAEAIAEARKTILERNPSAFDDKFRGAVPATPSPFRVPERGPSYYTSAPPPMVHSAHPHHHPHASPPSRTPGSAWPPSAYVVTPSSSSSPASMPHGSAGVNSKTLSSSPPPPRRINKFGCKCRRSFCLKKVCFVP